MYQVVLDDAVGRERALIRDGICHDDDHNAHADLGNQVDKQQQRRRKVGREAGDDEIRKHAERGRDECRAQVRHAAARRRGETALARFANVVQAPARQRKEENRKEKK